MYDINFTGDTINVYNDFSLRNKSLKKIEDVREITRGKYSHMQLRRNAVLNIKDVNSINTSLRVNIDYSITTSRRYRGVENALLGENKKGIISFLNRHRNTVGFIPENIVDVYHQNQSKNIEKHWIAGFIDNNDNNDDITNLKNIDLSKVNVQDFPLDEYTLKNLEEGVKRIDENLNDLREIIENKKSMYNKSQKSDLNYEISKGIKELEMEFRNFKKY